MGASRQITTRYAVFDLEHLATLSDAPSLSLLVSEQTKYLLNNLILRDIQDDSRYATEIFESGYVPVRETDKDWLFYKAIVARAALEMAEEDAMAGMIGFSEQFWLRSTHEKVGDGAVNVALDEVPEGENWRLQALCFSNDATDPSQVILRFRPGGNVFTIKTFAYPGTGQIVAWQGDFAMSEDQKVEMRMYDCDDGDTIQLDGWFIK